MREETREEEEKEAGGSTFTHIRCDWLQGDGRGQLVSLLAAATLLISSGIVVWSAIGGDENANSSWEQSSWMSWCLFYDPGTQGGVSADAPAKVKATALIFSVLGFLYNLIFGCMRNCNCCEWPYGNHILILGWNEKTLYLLNELFEALRSSADFSVSIVVLAEREHSEMHQEVQQRFYQIWEHLSFFDRQMGGSVYRLLGQCPQSQHRGLLLHGFPVCQKSFCSLLGIGKKRFERLRQAAVKEEPCPVDERFRPKQHEFLAPHSMRPIVYEWLEKTYLTTAEPLPEAYSVDAAASPPTSSRHFVKVDPDVRNEKGHSQGAKFLPPGTIGEYLTLTNHRPV
eukprot:s1336_g20.t1